MKTVDEFLRAGAALRVTCRNCGHSACLSARFLRARFKAHVRVVSIPFHCTRCRSQRVTLATAAGATAETHLAAGMHFGGIYSKYED